jgi:hypothetical protein
MPATRATCVTACARHFNADCLASRSSRPFDARLGIECLEVDVRKTAITDAHSISVAGQGDPMARAHVDVAAVELDVPGDGCTGRLIVADPRGITIDLLEQAVLDEYVRCRADPDAVILRIGLCILIQAR